METFNAKHDQTAPDSGTFGGLQVHRAFSCKIKLARETATHLPVRQPPPKMQGLSFLIQRV